MTYEEALEYIHRTDWRGSKLGLDRMRRLLSLLDNPQDRLRCVHVAGTNGKGSVCAMLASVLSAAGYKTGLTISPFIERFGERIQIGGAPIPDAELAALTEEVARAADSMDDHPTEFEMVCALAFLYFQRSGCELSVVEVGMGGRLDATNVIERPLCSVITPVGFDHMEYLGNTLGLIAKEKCGIIKPGCPVVTCEQEPEAQAVIEAAASELGCAVYRSGLSDITPVSDSLDSQTFLWRSVEYTIALPGRHQLANAAEVLTCIYALREGGVTIPESAVREGLRNARWPARFEKLSADPLFILDGAHNPHGAKALAAAASRYMPGGCVLLCGVLADKDYAEMFEILDAAAALYLATEPPSPRRLPADDLARLLAKYGKPVTAEPDAARAAAVAMAAAREKKLPVLACGSLYMAGDIRRAVRELSR